MCEHCPYAQPSIRCRMKLCLSASAVLHLLLLLGLVTRGWSLRVSGVLVPSVVVSGSTVELVCNYHHSTDRPDPLYSVKWYRDVNQFYEYIPRRNPPIRVYPLPHVNVDENRSSREKVALIGVTRETSGNFRCEVMGDKPFFETDDHAVNMTVVDVPAWGPELWDVTRGAKVRPRETVATRCLVGHSDPPADITWTINSVGTPSHAHIQRSIQTDQWGRRMQVSELQVTVTEAWLKSGFMTLSCHVQVSSVYHKTANVTLHHADRLQTAELGWPSSGSSPQSWMLLLMLMAVTLLVLVTV